MANPNPEEKLSPAAKRVISIVFFCLLLDLLVCLSCTHFNENLTLAT